MKTATEMTEKQRRAIEALQCARTEGVALSEYAKTHGLAIRELYDAIAALRRRGVMPKPMRRKSRGRFVAVRVVPERASSSAGLSVPLCRIVHASGCVIECTQWPPPSWVASLGTSSPDAAT
jgi:hypothetical protein